MLPCEKGKSALPTLNPYRVVELLACLRAMHREKPRHHSGPRTRSKKGPNCPALFYEIYSAGDEEAATLGIVAFRDYTYLKKSLVYECVNFCFRLFHFCGDATRVKFSSSYRRSYRLRVFFNLNTCFFGMLQTLGKAKSFPQPRHLRTRHCTGNALSRATSGCT